jgi:hypothetical protein
MISFQEDDRSEVTLLYTDGFGRVTVAVWVLAAGIVFGLLTFLGK